MDISEIIRKKISDFSDDELRQLIIDKQRGYNPYILHQPILSGVYALILESCSMDWLLDEANKREIDTHIL
ncbi:MAG: hypothetical protein AAF846_11195 [Chloroflexota bacterium]